MKLESDQMLRGFISS